MGVALLGGILGVLLPRTTPAQTPTHDFSVLRINEILSSNGSEGPADRAGQHLDMVELYNSGDQPLPLGSSSLANTLALSATAEPTALDLWYFPSGGASNIPAKGFVVVFLDDRPAAGTDCDLYTGFSLKNDGSEPITLWGPEQENGEREILDEVWPPPLPRDVSFGRFPDGAGDVRLSPEETLVVFRFYPPGTSTFGTCRPCPLLPPEQAVCGGAANGEGGNVAPRITRIFHSTNAPPAGEAVSFRVRVRDDKEPTPENLSRVVIRYTVDGAEQTDIPMAYDDVLGVVRGYENELTGESRPLDWWTEWMGEIPGQPAGARVDFHFLVEDGGESDGSAKLTDTDPSDFCDPGTGPCDREFGGPGCVLDEEDETCSEFPVTGARYFSCNVPFHYVPGHASSAGLDAVVIQQIVPSQQGIREDATEPPCTTDDNCPFGEPECCKSREDFIELQNTSEETVDISGCWLTDRPFHPRSWQFPEGSVLGPGEIVTVWLDNDGGKCPDPDAFNPPCFWECPDPTDPSAQEYHTDFALDADGDDIFLCDREENGFGVLHGLEFEDVPLNHALVWNAESLSWDLVNLQPGRFYRGDSNGDCGVDLADAVHALNHLFLGGPAPLCPDAADIDDNSQVELTDAVYLLNHLFLGGPEVPAPGMKDLGEDPTDDNLGTCEQTCSGS